MKTLLVAFALVTACCTIAGLDPSHAVTPADSLRVAVFSAHVIHFTPAEPQRYDSAGVQARDNGRVIAAEVDLPYSSTPARITARLTLHPIPKDEISVHDPWDRAGAILLESGDGPDVELIKFITAYGGETDYTVDLTHLAPILTGRRTIKAFIDTWITPGWRIDFSLAFTPDSSVLVPTWSVGALNEQSFDRTREEAGGLATTVRVPDSLSRVVLHYYISGHCTDGRGADEFESKDNVIRVDGRVVYRYRPWRDDCRRLRAINPYCRRWSDGSWSCDYDRSGWCPGDRVEPLELDLTDHLTAGEHEIAIQIEDIRPADSNGHHGYWRVSAQVIGYR